MDDLISDFKNISISEYGNALPCKISKLPPSILPERRVWLLMIMTKGYDVNCHEIFVENNRVKVVIIDEETACAFVDENGYCCVDSLPDEFKSAESFMKILFQ